MRAITKLKNEFDIIKQFLPKDISDPFVQNAIKVLYPIGTQNYEYAKGRVTSSNPWPFSHVNTSNLLTRLLYINDGMLVDPIKAELVRAMAANQYFDDAMRGKLTVAMDHLGRLVRNLYTVVSDDYIKDAFGPRGLQLINNARTEAGNDACTLLLLALQNKNDNNVVKFVAHLAQI